MDPKTAQILLGAAGSGGAGEPVYVDDVFSIDLWDGNGSTRSITNGVDLSGEGGYVVVKSRSGTYVNENWQSHDTERGYNKTSAWDSAAVEETQTNSITSFNSNGYSLGTDSRVNGSGSPYVGYTFRKAPGFFDVITYSGNGSNGREISHNLGSTPGMILIKNRDNNNRWIVWHRSLGDDYIYLNEEFNKNYHGAFVYLKDSSGNYSAPTSTTITLSGDTSVNSSSYDYVMYVFAHDDQSFGTDSDEAIIKCGSYTGTGLNSGNTVDLGFEPQWLLIKAADTTGRDWHVLDVMRGLARKHTERLFPNATYVEALTTSGIQPRSDGFELFNGGDDLNKSGDEYIYVAIRRPNKPIEDATDVFKANVETEARTTSGWTSLSGFVTDAFINSRNVSAERYTRFSARLTGGRFMYPNNSTSSEGTTLYYGYDTNDGIKESDSTLVGSSDKNIDFHFHRAPGVFDVVTYKGNGSATHAIPHSLGVVPELIVVRRQDDAASWYVKPRVNSATRVQFDQTNAESSTVTDYWSSTTQTSSNFYVGDANGVNQSSGEYIAYLFATLDGISKVGTYTGTAADGLQVDCGFTAGARFIIIKRLDGTGPWYVFNSTSGIVSGNDPYIQLQSTASELTNNDVVDPYNPGFIVNNIGTGVNASGGTYLFLAFA
jgi:hypothetical protein